MDSGEIVGCHYLTRRPVRIRYADGRITAVSRASRPAARSLWVAPALFDLQVNGYGGVDFQQDDLGESDLLRAVALLKRDGCARFLLTLITDHWTALMRRLKNLKLIRDGSSELRHAIAGWHIEGPFLSPKTGFHGAHDPAKMCSPTAAQIHELRTITGSDPVLLTIAPEQPGVLDAIDLATSLGMRVSVGHTDATSDTLRSAVAAGATGFTHLGNGCPRELDRHDNILWRVFETPGLTCSIIPDGIHVAPAAFRLFHRVLPSIYYTTDAMAAAGAPPGRYTIGKLEVEVGADQVVRQPGKPNFAGSALRPIDGVLRAAKMLQCPWQEAWFRFSEVPGRLMGLDSGLAPGGPAAFCLLEFEGESLSRVRMVDARV